MKRLFTLFGCLIFGSALAETIQHVEYHLPKAAENWVVGNQLESEKGLTIIYIPNGVDSQNAKEFFGVNANHLFSNANDPSTIQLNLTKMFPKMNIDFHVLKKSKDSVIYEWSAKEKGIEKLHGWGRAFSSKSGTVVLGYQTENISNIDEARSIWLPALEEAKQ